MALEGLGIRGDGGIGSSSGISGLMQLEELVGLGGIDLDITSLNPDHNNLLA